MYTHYVHETEIKSHHHTSVAVQQAQQHGDSVCGKDDGNDVDGLRNIQNSFNFSFSFGH